MTIKNIPNTLSVIRLIMVPLFVALFIADFTTAAIAVFILAGATDVLDGYIARKFNCTSTLGKILDPLADKFMQLAAFVCLWYKGLIPGWMPIIYLIKEIFTVIAAFVIFRKTRFVVKSNIFGKLSTVLVFGGVFVIAIFGDIIGKTGATAICLAITLYFVFYFGAYCVNTIIKNRKKSI
jgi:cardiolipin synthase